MPNQVNRIYQSAQMLKVCPLPANGCGQFKIKAHSEKGETDWLNITPDQFRAIERIILPKFMPEAPKLDPIPGEFNGDSYFRFTPK